LLRKEDQELTNEQHQIKKKCFLHIKKKKKLKKQKDNTQSARKISPVIQLVRD
jgi:hypothetical protein